MLRRIKRFIAMQKALHKGPKFHLGDVVNTDLGPWGKSLKGVAVEGIRFRHLDKYGDVLNRYEYKIQDDWFSDNYLKRYIMVEEECFI